MDDGDMPVSIENYYATEMGWVRRRDIGPNVWELPDGKLRRHHSNYEPMLAKCHWPPGQH